VEAVEIAEREHRAAELFGYDLVVEQPLHRRRVYRRFASTAIRRWKCRIPAATGGRGGLWRFAPNGKDPESPSSV
jgi:hypothetical protein